MKAQSDNYPLEIHDLGDGTYHHNTNVEEKTETLEDGRVRTFYEYDQELLVYPTEPIVPEEVAGWRLRRSTAKNGLTESISNFLNSIEDEDLREDAKEAWYSGTTIRRDSFTVAMFGQVFSLSESELDNLFIQAAAISA